MLVENFVTKIFRELDDLWASTGIDDTDCKLEEKDTAFEGFAGEPHAYFECLLLLNKELKDLCLPDELTCYVKRAAAGDTIFRYTICYGASYLDATWKDWLITHKKVLSTQVQPVVDSLEGMQLSAREHLDYMK